MECDAINGQTYASDIKALGQGVGQKSLEQRRLRSQKKGIRKIICVDIEIINHSDISSVEESEAVTEENFSKERG